ncbi:MAG: sel1 repeat family protein [Methylococcales bacterium]|jgi:hypothetical protein|nr:sel1 repeat family protein [Methylococcales bacterium]MBT4598671.1 sel1 repeat family protein [Methylococcales bacterium]MDG2364369.1 tetratricopeptide repeat protein [Methylococcaceae bacterium]
MKRLITIICLTIAVLIESVGVSESADFVKGFVKGLTAFQRGNLAIALREFTPLAEQGDVNAQYFLGRTYQEVVRNKGQGITADNKPAVKWFTLAAKQGDQQAQNSLGLMYRNGEGIPKDHKTAVKWFTLAAKQGYYSAQFNLGVMYEGGEGVLQDDKTAVKWYRLAAEQGNATAQTNLSMIYGMGSSVIQNNVYAYMWGNIAASNGSEDGAMVRDLAKKSMTPSQVEKAQDLARECIRKKLKGC